jgi:hypothetical protein
MYIVNQKLLNDFIIHISTEKEKAKEAAAEYRKACGVNYLYEEGKAYAYNHIEELFKAYADFDSKLQKMSCFHLKKK